MTTNDLRSKQSKPPKKLSHERTSLLNAAILASMLGLGPATVQAGIIDWDGDTSADWAVGTNWVGGVAPVSDLTTDIANFNLATYGGNPVFAPDAGTTSINGITIGALNGAMNLNATNLTIGGGGITVANGAGTLTIAGSTVTLGAAQSWLNSASNPLTVGTGAVSNGGFLLTFGGSGDTTVFSAINGAGGLSKTGAGILTLSGANAFSGAVNINGGTLSIASSGNLGDASVTNTLALAGGTLRSTGFGNVDLTANRTIALGAGGGTFDVGNTASDFLSLTGTISGATALTKIGTGSLSLAADNSATFSGAINVNNGVLSLAHVSGLGTGVATVNSGAMLQTGVANAKLAGVLVQPGGVLRLNNPQDTTAGATIPTAPIAGILELRNSTIGANFDGIQMAAGSVVRSNLAGVNYGSDLTLLGAVDFDTANQNFTISGSLSGTSGAINKISANTLTLTGTNTFSGPVTINAGTLSVGVPSNLGDASATNTIAFGGGILRSTANMDLGTTRTIAVGASGGTLSAQTATTLTVSGSLSGTGTLSAAGGGTIVLSADNSGFGGNFTVDSVSGNTTNTTLRPLSATALPATTVITVNPGAAAASGNGNQVALPGVSIGSGVSLVLNTVGGASNFRSTLLADASTTNTWAGGIEFGGDGNAGLNVGANATLTINGNITGPGYTGTAFLRGTGTGVMNGAINLPGGTIAKTDAGSWALNSSGNTWVNTTVAVGTLTLGAANALPTATAVTLGQNDANNPTLNLNGFSQTIASLASNPATIALTGIKTLTSATPATLTIDGFANTTYAGLITGALSLVKSGTGIQTLAGANTYTGTTTISVGSVLNVQSGLALGATAAGTLVPAGAALQLQNGAGVGAEPLALSGTGISSDGALRNISGGNTYGGLVTLGSNTRINSDAGLLTLDVVSGDAITGAFDLTFGGAGNITVADPIATSIGTITKDGSGTLTLAGTNSYSGTTTVNEGTLQLANPNSLYGGNSGSWTAANLYVKNAATLALNVDSFGSNGFASFSLDTLLTNISVANTAAEGLQAGATLALNTSTATGAIFTQGGPIANSTGAFGGTIGLTKLGTGTLVLDKVNTYTGTTTINAGTLELDRQTGSLATTTPITFSGTGTFNMDNVGAGGALTQTLGALTFSAGDGTVRTTRTADLDQAITFASLAPRSTGATGNFVNTGTNSATNGFVFTAAPTAGTLIDRGLFYNGSSYAAYDAGGFVRAYGSGDTDYLAAPAGTTIGASTSTSNVDLTTGNITAQTTASANTINMRGFNIAMTGTSPVLSTDGLLSGGSATATLGGGTTPRLQPTTAGGELVVRVNGSTDVLTISSVIQNNGSASSLTKTGAGTLSLTAVNTFTGPISINAGTLKYASATATIAGNVTIGSGATLDGGSALGANLTFTGPVLNDGTIVRTANGTTIFNNTISGTGSISNGAAGKLELNASNTFSGGVTQAGDASGNNFMTLGNGGALGTGTFTIASNGEVRSSIANLVNANNNPILLNSNFSFAGSNNANLGTGPVTLSGNRTITVKTTVTLTLGGVIGETGGSRSLTKADTGTLVLGGAGSTYSGGTTVSAGTLRLATSDVLADFGALTVGGGTFDLQTFSDYVAAVTLTSGSITGTGGTLTGTSYNLQSGTVSANLAGPGVALTKNASGTVVLSGANTYTGMTTVNAGILTFANQASLYAGSTADWTAANINVKAGGTIAVNVDSAGTNGFDATALNTLITNISVASDANAGLQVASSIGFDTSTATGGTFTLPNPLANSTGAFGGTIGLAKLGAGTLVLDKANTNTGPTAIYAGTLQLEDTGVIPTASMLNNGTFVINKSGALTQGTNVPSLMSGTGSLNYAGGDTLTLNAANLYSGSTTISSGTLALTSALALQNSALVTTSGIVALSGPTTLTLGGLSGATGDLASVISSGYGGVTALTLNPIAGSVTYGGVIADGASGMTLTKTGAGTQVLQGANTYTGATTLTAGTLELSGAGSILNTAGITLSGGTLAMTNTAAETAPGRLADGTGITANGGTIGYNNTSGASVYAETIGSVALTSGQTNFVLGTNQAGAGTQTLTLSGLTRTGSGNVSVVTFSANTTAPNATKNRIVVTGATATTAGQIIGPWATTGTTAANQTDYAVYNTSAQVVPAAIAASAETTWTAAANAYTLGGASTLTATRTITALRYSGNAQTLSLGTSSFSLETYGVLNGGSGLLTIARGTGGTGALRTPAGGGNLYVTSGNNAITVSAPITDSSDSQPVTLVKSGAGTLTLSGTSTYSGGTVINGGRVVISADANLGNAGGGITVNGDAELQTANVTSSRSITLNNGAIFSTGGNSTFTTTGNVTGTGGVRTTTISFGSNWALNGTGNTFEGPVLIGINGSGGNSYTVSVASLADSATANGRIEFNSLGTHATLASSFIYTGATNLVLNNRQIWLTSANAAPGHKLFSNGAGTLTINTDMVVTGTGARLFSLRGTNTGANTFAGKILDGPGAPVSLTKADAGSWTLAGANTYSGPTTISGGTLRVTGSVLSSSGVSVSTGATFEVGANQGVNNLTLTGSGPWTGKVNLFDKDLVVVNPSSFANVLDQVKQGRGTGAWNATTGITTSSSTNITGLGAVRNSNDGGVTPIFPASFNGTPVTANSVLIKYTYNGDANLDGAVTADDYFRIDAGFLASGTGWYNGDFNYDGLIDIDDYFLIDQAYVLQSGPLGGGSAPVAPAAPSAAVPEPGTLSLLALGAAALLGRRRRSR